MAGRDRKVGSPERAGHFRHRGRCEDPDRGSPPPGDDLHRQPGKYQVAGGVLQLFAAGEEFLEGKPREVILQRFLVGKGWGKIETCEGSAVKMSNGCVDHYLKVGYQMMGYGIQRYLAIQDKKRRVNFRSSLSFF